LLEKKSKELNGATKDISLLSENISKLSCEPTETLAEKYKSLEIKY